MGEEQPGLDDDVAPGEETVSAPGLSRREALARLGLSSVAAYSAPTILRIDRSANATILPTPCPSEESPGCPGGGEEGEEGFGEEDEAEDFEGE